MKVLTHRLFLAGVDHQARRTARRLRKPDPTAAVQERCFRDLTQQLAATHFGRSAGIGPSLSYEQFRRQVPLRTYSGFESWIQRIQSGESDVLWPGSCTLFALTSGTTSGKPKAIPMTAALIEHFRTAGSEALLMYAARVGHTKVFRGKHLYLGGSQPVAPLPKTTNPPAYGGDLSSIAALHAPSWAATFLQEPDSETSQIADWESRIDTIIERAWNLDIRLLAGLPPWIIYFASRLRDRVDAGSGRLVHLQLLWRNLECLVHGGMLASPFLEQLRADLGPSVNFQEVHVGSEAFLAAQDAESGGALRLLTQTGVFFEFLPLKHHRANADTISGENAVPAADVKTGVDYAVIVTTPGGLTRYLTGDVVRFVSREPPRLLHVGQIDTRLNALEEDLSERALTEALNNVCQRNDWKIVSFHVAPLIDAVQTTRRRGRHEWWVELNAGTKLTPTGPIIGEGIDAELQASSDTYRNLRESGTLSAPVVRLVIPGVFANWMRQHGLWGGQARIPRACSDRRIASELAELTRFSTNPPFSFAR